jgi:histidinol dehydrogenase
MKIIEGFEPLKSILSRQGPSSGFETDEREKTVRSIITEVSRRGDAALYEYTRRFDGVTLDSLEVSKDQLTAFVQSFFQPWAWLQKGFPPIITPRGIVY